MKNKRYWIIQGWESDKLLFERKVLCGQITEKQMKLLLRCLVAKLSLNYDEIINSYAKRRTRIHANHLEVKYSNGKNYMLTCGDNPFVTAQVEHVK